MLRTLYSPLLKTEENDDGTLSFEGIASTEAVDSSGETVLASAIEAALPDFMALGTGNLREMHQLSAAGVIDKAEVNANGETLISGTVVDETACKKVRAGVYKGLSVGGKVLARDPKNKKIITKIKLVEISLVDRPACPEAVLTMWKAEDNTRTTTLSIDEIREALDALPMEARAIVFIKAALALPRSAESFVCRRSVG